MIDLFGHEPLRALTWKEPFGSLMLKGKIETRTWPTKYRGLVLICAGKAPYNYNQLKSICGYEEQLTRVMSFWAQDGTQEKAMLGHAIAIGRLIDCRPMRTTDEAQCFVEYHPDLWCHIYADVRPIEPIPWKGKQGWAKVPEEVRSKIKML